jgi:hypothetical protein
MNKKNNSLQIVNTSDGNDEGTCYREGIIMSVRKTEIEKSINLENLTQDEKMKYEIAEELGLLDRVLESGWKSLTSKETGRIGGLMNKKRRKIVKK